MNPFVYMMNVIIFLTNFISSTFYQQKNNLKNMAMSNKFVKKVKQMDIKNKICSFDFNELTNQIHNLQLVIYDYFYKIKNKFILLKLKYENNYDQLIDDLRLSFMHYKDDIKNYYYQKYTKYNKYLFPTRQINIYNIIKKLINIFNPFNLIRKIISLTKNIVNVLLKIVIQRLSSIVTCIDEMRIRLQNYIWTQIIKKYNKFKKIPKIYNFIDINCYNKNIKNIKNDNDDVNDDTNNDVNDDVNDINSNSNDDINDDINDVDNNSNIDNNNYDNHDNHNIYANVDYQDMDKTIDKLKEKITKTDLMGFILNALIKYANIQRTEYVVIAGYTLKNYKEISHMDIIITNDAYQKLLNLKSSVKMEIRENKKIIIKFPSISDEAELKFFEYENAGFFSKDISIKILNSEDYLSYDKFGNPHLNLKTTINFYSNIKLQNGKYIIGENYEVTKERVEKTILLLELLNKNIKEKEYLINKQIDYLNGLIKT